MGREGHSGLKSRASRIGAAAAASTCAALASLAISAQAEAVWAPGPAKYGVGQERHVPIEMADGTTLYADVYYPIDEASGEAAEGDFPVALMITPYGKVGALATGNLSGEEEGGVGNFKFMPLLVRRGYINVVAELRGTGRSEGSFDMLDPQQGKDGAEIVRWAAKLPNSSGEVGMYGPSYMGIIQFLTAGELGPGSPLKALFPVVTPNDVYRELVTAGGLLAAESTIPLFAIFGALPVVEPLLDPNPPPVEEILAALGGRPPAILENLLPLGVDMITGGERAYDEEYWNSRGVAGRIKRVVRNRIPAMLVGGWLDVFQRGALMNYAGLQNVWAGRPQNAPMLPDQKVTSRYQAVMGPWSHVAAGEDFPLERLTLRWFDTWLRDMPTGLKSVRNPVHLYDMGRGGWFDAQRYPLQQARAKTFYFGPGGDSGAPSQNDGTLTRRPPSAASGSDPVLYTGISSPCTLTTEQYSLGAAAILLGSTGNPCVQDDTTNQFGPGSLTYTSAPFEQPATIAGPITASIFATSTRPEVELVATVDDISPSGRSRPLSSGALLGSFRAVEDRRTWNGANGRPLLPYHPYTRASASPVPTGGQVSRFDIEVFPIFATLAPGHSLRVTITTSDTPHLLPSPTQFAGLLGGVYDVRRNAEHASFINLPLAPAERLSAPCGICGEAQGLGG